MLKVPSFGKTFICIDDKNNREYLEKKQNQKYTDIRLKQKIKF